MIPKNTIAITVNGGVINDVALFNWLFDDVLDRPVVRVIDYDNINAGDEPDPVVKEIIDVFEGKPADDTVEFIY
jgi:hypothetical protein